MFIALARIYFLVVMVPTFELAAAIRRLFGKRLDVVGHSLDSTWTAPGNDGAAGGWRFFVAIITLPLSALIRLDHLWGNIRCKRGAKRSTTLEISPFIYQMH